MPTLFTHALVGSAVAAAAGPARGRKLTLLTAACAMAPDLDVIGFAYGIPYHDLFGHRGFFHSLFFAFVLSLAVLGLGLRELRPFGGDWWRVLALLFVATASHGILDAFTNGGLGVALLAPFDDSRFFFPWTPIQVSPIGLQGFLSERGLATLESELLWVWLPTCSIWLGLWLRGRRQPAQG